MAPQKEIVLKLTSFRYRPQGMTEEQFHDYASKIHAPKAALVQQRHGALRVEQYHTPQSCRDLLKEKMPWAIRPGWKIEDHDAQISVWVRTTEQMHAIIMDPDFQAIAKDDLDHQNNDDVTIAVGWVEVYVDDNKIVGLDESGNSLYSQSFMEKSAVAGQSARTEMADSIRF